MGKPRPLSPFEQFHTYMRGWRCGTGTGFLDPKFTMHERREFRQLYMEGYKQGRQARIALQAKLCRRFKYKPSILRAADTEKGEG